MIEINGKRIKVTIDEEITVGVAEVISDESGADILIRILDEGHKGEVGTILLSDRGAAVDIY
jgi:hypothetical protein